MKWQILILTQPSRAAMLAQLLNLLREQMAEWPPFGEKIQVLTRLFDPKLTLGENREKLREQATAEYISFVDDDDLIPKHFIRTIFAHLTGVDQVSFNVKCFSDKHELGPAFHSLQFKHWHQLNGRLEGTKPGLYRDISHVTPMRRTLAMLCKMEGGIGEDCRWATAMRATGKVKTENYIEDFLYFYLWRGRRDDAKDATDPWRLNFIKQLRK
jgi:hypothetical protein